MPTIVLTGPMLLATLLSAVLLIALVLLLAMNPPRNLRARWQHALNSGRTNTRCAGAPPYRNPGEPGTEYLQHLHLLGLPVRDKVTHREGVVTSLCYDLFGCIQAAVDPGYKDDGSRHDVSWFDVSRLSVQSETPVMAQPHYLVNGPVARGEHGPADKPVPGARV